jgi:HD-GYP domain-containing protein (c-di-GMP phosphodiesterase class II)
MNPETRPAPARPLAGKGRPARAAGGGAGPGRFVAHSQGEAMSALKTSIVDNLDEEYYQISPDILASFPKFRPPLNLYILNESVAQIQLLKKAGERLDKAAQDHVAELCAGGNVFVARSDHPVYAKHISKQLDLVLLDKNLKEGEIAEIFAYALTARLEEFFAQAVPAVFDLLYRDLMVLTEFLFADLNRVRSLVRRMHNTHSLARHSFNCGALGLWLLAKAGGDVQRKAFDKAALALFLHDMGMSKIPSFIRDKQKPLTPDERTKITQHPQVGAAMALKLNLRFDEMALALMQHHERLDGSGYPNRTKDPDLKPISRICAVADSFCAMITKRPYAEAKDIKHAAAELSRDSARYDGRYTGALASAALADERVFALEAPPDAGGGEDPEGA